MGEHKQDSAGWTVIAGDELPDLSGSISIDPGDSTVELTPLELNIGAQLAALLPGLRAGVAEVGRALNAVFAGMAALTNELPAPVNPQARRRERRARRRELRRMTRRPDLQA